MRKRELEKQKEQLGAGFALSEKKCSNQKNDFDQSQCGAMPCLASAMIQALVLTWAKTVHS